MNTLHQKHYGDIEIDDSAKDFIVLKQDHDGEPLAHLIFLEKENIQRFLNLIIASDIGKGFLKKDKSKLTKRKLFTLIKKEL